MQRLVELSHVIEDGMVTYPGLPGPLICDFMSHDDSHGRYAEGTEFQIGRIDLVSNTGTYVDVPFHRYRDGDDLADVGIERLAHLDALVVDASGRSEISAELFRDLEVGGRAVLVRTGWDRHWRTETYLSGNPFLTRDAAEHLASRGAALVGIDSLNIDSIEGGERPVHTTLLGEGIPIVEHLTGLAALPAAGFRFTAAPPRVRGMGTFPVRAFAIL